MITDVNENKWRKKPVVIEAVLWDGNKISSVPQWISEALEKNPDQIGMMFRFKDEVQIRTLEGVMTAAPGDYIIQGIKGELYPCKPDIFEQTYDKVEPALISDGEETP